MTYKEQYLNKLKKLRRLHWLTIAIFLISGVITIYLSDHILALIYYMLIPLGSSIYVLYSNRCPHCNGRYRKTNPLQPSPALEKFLYYCPLCGISLTNAPRPELTISEQPNFDKFTRIQQFSLSSARLFKFFGLIFLAGSFTLGFIEIVYKDELYVHDSLYRPIHGLLMLTLCILMSCTLISSFLLKCPHCNTLFSYFFNAPSIISGGVPKETKFCPTCGKELIIKK